MKLTDEMIIDVCKKLVGGDLSSNDPHDCDLCNQIIEKSRTDIGMMDVIRHSHGSVVVLLHANHHMIIDCIRAGWRLREEMQGCEELERMFK